MYTDTDNYDPSSSDLLEASYSLLYLRVLEALKEVRDHLNLYYPTIGVYMDVYDLLVCAYYRGSAIITMNDTDTLLEATTEHLLKGVTFS